MKKLIVPLVSFALFFASCNQPAPVTTGSGRVPTKVKTKLAASPSPGFQFIPVDSANKMLSSYLNSINYQKNDTDLRSLIFNADSLIAYLTSAKMANVKFMFAHTLDYINNGGQNQYAGYQSGALTLIVAGYDSSGNYVYYKYTATSPNMVMDHSMPCPASCPTTGTAANDLLTQ